MFRIGKLRINTEKGPKELDLNKNGYVYGPTAKGKTVLTLIIDYMLGSSTWKEHEGLDGIENVEISFKNDADEIWFKREIYSKNLWHKLSEGDSYRKIDLDEYKAKIRDFYSSEIKDVYDIYNEFFDEKMTHRTTAFLNFVEEKGLGDLSSVFTQAREIRNAVRIRDVMSFIFNRDNLLKLKDEKAELERKKEELEKMQLAKKAYDFYLSIIQNGMGQLSIKLENDVIQDREKFNLFKKDFSRKQEPVVKEDYIYLLQASHSLSEELKLQIALNRQAKERIAKNERSIFLLDALKDIVSSNEEYSKYVAPIVELVDDGKNRIEVFSAKDYSSTIKKIVKEKAEIDEQIELLSASLSVDDYYKTKEQIEIIDAAFGKLGTDPTIEKIEMLKSSIKSLEESIKKRANNISQKDVDEFNELITGIYRSISDDVEFKKDDFLENGFQIKFNPNKVLLSGSRVEIKENGMEEEEYYNPGSMARCTCWQVSTYLAMQKFLISKFSVSLCLPILIFDCPNQPFDHEENGAKFKSFYEMIIKQGKKIGIQIIMISTVKPDDVEVVDFEDISSGLNPAHKSKS